MNDLKFDDRGLMPAIVQDWLTGQVRMCAFVNQEAIARTVETGRATFFSRSRGALWEKGETSGNTLHVRELYVDCDADTLLILAEPAGNSCHTGQAELLLSAPRGRQSQRRDGAGRRILEPARSGDPKPSREHCGQELHQEPSRIGRGKDWRQDPRRGGGVCARRGCRERRARGQRSRRRRLPSLGGAGVARSALARRHRRSREARRNERSRGESVARHVIQGAISVSMAGA